MLGLELRKASFQGLCTDQTWLQYQRCIPTALISRVDSSEAEASPTQNGQLFGFRQADPHPCHGQPWFSVPGWKKGLLPHCFCRFRSGDHLDWLGQNPDHLVPANPEKARIIHHDDACGFLVVCRKIWYHHWKGRHEFLSVKTWTYMMPKLKVQGILGPWWFLIDGRMGS